jgi:hypothetical protein
MKPSAYEEVFSFTKTEKVSKRSKLLVMRDLELVTSV